MGKNNRIRRAAKRKQRARSNTAHRPDGQGSGERSGHRTQRRSADAFNDSEPWIEPELLIAGLIDLAPARQRLGDRRFVDDATARLGQFPVDDVRRAVAAELRRTIVALWSGGWQPIEVVRQSRRTSAAAAQLARYAIAADQAARAASTVDDRWARQLDDLVLPDVDHGRGETWVGSWAHAAGLDRAGELAVVFDLLVALRALPRLDPLIPPPGTAPGVGATSTGAAGVSSDILDKVRSLLVKAESTTFEAEAEAFTAKAHELMTRHAIDVALVDADRTGPTDAPITVRIAVDDPYVDAKSLLLQEVAQASRCRTVFHTGLAMSRVVGFASDVAATEMLYTSLLVQAQSALAAEARRATAGSRARSRSYRGAFLLSFAIRIGQRLTEVNEVLVAEAETASGRSVLPVLRDRQALVDDAVEARFAGVQRQSVSGGSDAAGWAHGRHAADQAQLNFGEVETESGT